MSARIAAVAVAVALYIIATGQPADAQESDNPQGLSVHLVPYIWLPTIDTTVKYPVLGGGTATTVVSSGPGDYIPKLHFAAMLAGEIDYDRIALLSDVMYLSAGASGALRSFDFGGTHIPIEGAVASNVGINVQATVWTLAGSYTVAAGSWGNVDLLAGFRLLAADQATSFALSAEITRPDGSVALGRSGILTAGRKVWNGIGGIRGRIYLGDADWLGGGRFYLPFYFDVGGGGSHPTWQAFGGIGYQTRAVGLSLGYRYLAFEQGSSAVIPKLRLGGPIIVANFTF